MELSPKMRFILCRFVLPVMKTILNRVEQEVKESPNPYDDLALDIAKTVIQFIEEFVCKSE